MPLLTELAVCVAEDACKVQGAGGRAEKLKLAKQSTLRPPPEARFVRRAGSLATEDRKAEIARRRARRLPAPSCPPHLPIPRGLHSQRPWFSLSAFRSPVSGFSVSAFQRFSFLLRVFHPQPVEQRALGLLLAGIGFGQAPSEMASNRRSALFHL
jgi:hypothetical protein